jgi:hypothetical protein
LQIHTCCASSICLHNTHQQDRASAA